jgi:DNA-binding LacI/PurR family transcriptional regulator
VGRKRTGSITLVDVARASGFSRSVVSRALLGQSGVGEETTRIVREAADRLGYVPNQLAQALTGGRTATLGLVLRNTRTSFYGELADAVAEHAHRSGYRVVSVGAGSDARGYHDAIRHLRTLNVDGLMLSSSVMEEDTVLSTMREIPTVVVGRGRLDDDSVSRVSLAQDAPADLVDGLLAAGHEHFGLLHHSRRSSPTQHERNEDTQDHIESRGARVSRGVVRDGDVAAAVDGVLRRGATALLCAVDPLALDVLEILRQRGVDVPGEVSVVGFDGLGGYAHPFVGLTTYRLPIEEMAREVVAVLLRRVEDENRGVEHIELYGQVVPGRTARIRVSDRAEAVVGSGHQL